MRTLEVGEVTRLRARFLDEDGTPTNPTAVTLYHTDPSGNETTVLQAALTNPEAGVWTYDLTVDEAGLWTYRFEGTGAVVAGETDYLLVLAEGASPTAGPCEAWIDADDVFTCSPCSDIAAVDRDWGLAANAAEAASRILYELSLERYPGVCRDVVRPCLCCEPGHNGSCDCGNIEEFRLGGLPVLAIVEVLQDGAALVEGTDYRLDNHGYLVRIDGEGWPSSQQMDLATTAADTWQVTYLWGRQPPADGVAAAKALACQMYSACSGSETCSLPKQVQSIVRQGVEIGFERAEDMFKDGRTGIYVVDLFLEAESRRRTHAPAAIVSPDTVSRLRRAGT